MRVLAAGAIIALLTMPAFSQDKSNGMQKLEQQRERDAMEIDKAYQKTLQSTRTTAPPAPKADPWGNLRAQDTGSQSKSK